MKVHPADLAAIRAEKIDVEGAIVREQGCEGEAHGSGAHLGNERKDKSLVCCRRMFA